MKIKHFPEDFHGKSLKNQLVHLEVEVGARFVIVLEGSLSGKIKDGEILEMKCGSVMMLQSFLLSCNLFSTIPYYSTIFAIAFKPLSAKQKQTEETVIQLQKMVL